VRRKLLVIALVLVALAAAADVLVKKAAEGQIADKARSQSGAQAAADAHNTSFPFIGRLLVSGHVPEIDVRVERPVAGSVTLASVAVDLADVHLDKHRLLSDHKAEITGIGSGKLVVDIDGPALTTLAHVDVQVGDGQIQVSVRGHTLQATPGVDGKGQLTLQLEGLPAVPIKLPKSDLVPCQATTVQVRGNVVELGCPFSEVPPALLRAAQAAMG
jgi:hypothetical protein